MQMKKLVSQVSRTGRDQQRYNFQGCRQVVGCVPYRFRNNDKSLSINGIDDQLEFLLISSQKSSKWMFPKGGWEKDETIEEAAIRETMEEAGVLGVVGNELGCWTFKSKSQDKYREGYMLSFRVTNELDVWPEKDSRKRIWVSASEAREKCEYLWMKLALDSFISQLNQFQIVDQEFNVSIFSDSFKVDDEELRIKEENYMTPYLIRLFRINEPSIHIMDEEERVVTPCCLDFLRSKESRFVIQSGEEDAIIS